MPINQCLSEHATSKTYCTCSASGSNIAISATIVAIPGTNIATLTMTRLYYGQLPLVAAGKNWVEADMNFCFQRWNMTTFGESIKRLLDGKRHQDRNIVLRERGKMLSI